MIGTALRAAAAYVDENAITTEADPHHRLSDEQRSTKGLKIRAIARDLRELAEASEARRVRYTEYGALKEKLYAFGVPLAPKLDQNVATAFREAEGPVKPQKKGWLKQS